MAEEEANLPEDIVNFYVPSVPQFYDFSRIETPEEIARREAFFTTMPEDKENTQRAAPAVPQFKVPAPPPSASSSSRTDTTTASSSSTIAQDVSPVNLSQLAAFRGPRAPLRRSNMNAAPAATAAANTNGAPTSDRQPQQPPPSGVQAASEHQPRAITAGAAAAARAAERRRSASARRSAATPTQSSQEQRRRSGSSSTAAPSSATRMLVPRVRASSTERPMRHGTPGVQTRAMAAAAAAANSSATDADGAIEALTTGVARLHVARAANRRQPAAAVFRRSSGAAGARVTAPSATTRPSAGPAGPVRVAAPIRAADRALAAATAAAAAEGGGGAAPRLSNGSGVAMAPGSAPRPMRKPTAESISRLSQPRERQTRDAAATPKRDFNKVLRTYPADNRPPGRLTVPDTPAHMRRSASTTRASGAHAAPAAVAPSSAPRPRVDVGNLVNRLAQPRTLHTAAAAAGTAPATMRAGGGGGGLPAGRRLPSIPLGRTHGIPVVRRTTPAALVAPAARSRSNSAARANVAAGGGLVHAAGSLQTASAASSAEQQV